MNCAEFEKNISERVGHLFLDESEKQHMSECSNCAELYDSYLQIETSLKQIEIEPMSANEFAVMQQKLDEKITQFTHKAFSFYRLSTRYGAGLAAAAFLFFVSLWSGFEYGVYYAESSYTPETYYATNYTSDDEEEETIDDAYINLLLHEYTIENGFNSGDALLGDLTQDELEYLENNLKVGDIL